MKTSTLNVSCYSFISVVLSAVFSVNTYAVNFAAKSEAVVRGSDPGLGVKFSSVLTRENYVVVDIRLENGKRIVSTIDYATQQAFIKSSSQKTDAPVSITEQDIFLLNMLRKSLGPVASRTGDALTSILGFLSEAPPGEVVNIVTDKASTVEPQAIGSLCAITGDTTTGTYTIKKGKKEQQLEETVQVGPCYNESNECLGRCGPGCAAPPDSTIQRFAQDCLNHDLCRRATGRNFGPCGDEWRAAADDFLFASDCGNVTDVWNDDFGFIWNLNQSDTTVIPVSGSVDVPVPQCGTWSVLGTHVGADVSLTATNPPPIEEGCCTAFTYTGPLNSCKTANGTWTNACELSGEWGMSREGAIQPIPSPEGVTPASSKPGDTCPDTTPPTTPTGLTPVPVSSSQIDLSWNPSVDPHHPDDPFGCVSGIASYRVSRCTGEGCTTFVTVGFPTTNSFSNTDLSSSTPYTYRVKANDTAGNVSPNSGTVSATTLP